MSLDSQEDPGCEEGAVEECPVVEHDKGTTVIGNRHHRRQGSTARAVVDPVDELTSQPSQWGWEPESGFGVDRITCNRPGEDGVVSNLDTQASGEPRRSCP